MDLTQWTDGTVVMNGTHAAHSATDFEILSSVRADKDLASSPKNTLLSNDDNAMEPSPFYMLRYHRDRMLHAAKDFGWADTYSTIVGPSGLSYLRQALHSYLASISDRGNLPEPLKVHVPIYRGVVE